MGKASIIPVIFGVNEPVIFGMPIVLNPYMFVPFLVAPMVNAIIGKFFIDVIGMNAPHVYHAVGASRPNRCVPHHGSRSAFSRIDGSAVGR